MRRIKRLTFYYYKNVELTANSDTKVYNGQEQSVSGFTGAPERADFSAIQVGAKGTDAGEYPAVFAEGTIGTVDKNEKYIVTGATGGKLDDHAGHGRSGSNHRQETMTARPTTEQSMW